MPDSPLNAETLSRWLSRSGTLSHGAVETLTINLEHETSISRLIFVTATYSADAPADLPRDLVIKSPLIPIEGQQDTEVQFYRQIGPTLATPPLTRCLAAIDDEGDDENERSIVVLEDLRATHDHPPWPLPPSPIQCRLAMEALVQLHARWWEAPALGRSVGKLHTVDSLTTMVRGVSGLLPAFFDACGDSLTREHRDVIERVFASSFKPWLRLTDSRALTIIHGDAHTWNLLFPRSGHGPAYLFDWQLWHIDVGARDLAFLMALHWYPARRAELERPLIRYYYEGLIAHGVQGYTFDELWLDYRRCAIRNLTIPILFWSRGMKPEGWWHRLECAVSAYLDLGCDDLL